MLHTRALVSEVLPASTSNGSRRRVPLPGRRRVMLKMLKVMQKAQIRLIENTAEEFHIPMKFC